MEQSKTHLIVFGNEKGGTGKSTLAMHVVVCLLRQGRTVGLIDLDSRQRTLTRFLENRVQFIQRERLSLPLPQCITVPRSQASSVKEQVAEEQERLEKALDKFRGHCDFIAVDCPGSYTTLSRLAHAVADTLVTPMNDSFIDLDLLGQVNADTWQVDHLSHYAEMVFESRKFRSATGRPPTDWIVTRNRLSTLASQNNRRMEKAIAALQKRILFRALPGLSERVIYRELFPKGLTMMDLDQIESFGKLQMSHVAARNEVYGLVNGLNLPQRKADAA
ncbi:MAG: ATPase [Lysobacteraceae bacterium]|nr:MAG: ATPase [Xanthomonadaceae bacterium]